MAARRKTPAQLAAEKKAALKKAFITLAAELNIEEGDTVKVLRPFVRDEMGCDLDPADNGNVNNIGKERKVEYANDGLYELDDNSVYPFFCLQKVPNLLLVKNITDGEYDAEIAPNGLEAEVGCQVVEFTKVEELYNAMKAAQAAFKTKK